MRWQTAMRHESTHRPAATGTNEFNFEIKLISQLFNLWWLAVVARMRLDNSIEINIGLSHRKCGGHGARLFIDFCVSFNKIKLINFGRWFSFDNGILCVGIWTETKLKRNNVFLAVASEKQLQLISEWTRTCQSKQVVRSLSWTSKTIRTKKWEKLFRQMNGTLSNFVVKTRRRWWRDDRERERDREHLAQWTMTTADKWDFFFLSAELMQKRNDSDSNKHLEWEDDEMHTHSVLCLFIICNYFDRRSPPHSELRLTRRCMAECPLHWGKQQITKSMSLLPFLLNGKSLTCMTARWTLFERPRCGVCIALTTS